LEKQFRIEILEGNVLEIFDGINPEPFARQPYWPDGTAWANADEAMAWGEQVILSITDQTADFAGNSPAEPTISRPIPLTGIASIKQKLISGLPLTEEEADLLLSNI
jgi:hypothetical protein